MRKVFSVIAKFLATIFAFLFVVTAVLALLLFTIGQRVFTAELYKRALAEEQVYTRLPSIIAEQLASSMSYNPCAENPLVCEDIPPELKACYTQVLGEERYLVLASGRDQPSEAERQSIQPCLDQYGQGGDKGNILTMGTPEQLACYKQALGEEVYTTLADGERPPTEAEFVSLTPCWGYFTWHVNPFTLASRELKDCLQNSIGRERFDWLAGSGETPTEAEMQEMAPCFAQYGLPSEVSTNVGGPPPFMANLKPKDWETIIVTLIPPEDLQSTTENVLDQIFAYFNGETDTVTIPLVKIKERLTGPTGTDAVVQLLHAQPPCTEDELAQLAAGMISGEMVFCSPPDDALEAMTPMIEEQLSALAIQIPDEKVILGSESFTAGEDPRDVIQMARLILRLSPLLPGSMLMLVTLFGVRSLKGWLRWWGIPTFFAGSMALVAGIFTLPGFNWAWDNYVAGRIPPYFSPNLVEMGYDLARYIVHGVTEPITLAGLILSLIGLALWVVSYFVKTKSKQNTTESPPPEPAA